MRRSLLSVTVVVLSLEVIGMAQQKKSTQKVYTCRRAEGEIVRVPFKTPTRGNGIKLSGLPTCPPIKIGVCRYKTRLRGLAT